MREIGKLDRESDAQLFSDYLYGRDIENQAEQNRDGSWSLWVVSEEQMDEAEKELERFLADPSDPVYESGAKLGRARYAQKARELARSRDQIIDVRTQFHKMRRPRVGPLTAALISLSVVVTAAHYLPLGFNPFELFLISAYRLAEPPLSGGAIYLPEIAHGQLWRLVTPIFLHFGLLHILFNMMWLASLGGEIEQKEGTLYFGAQVLLLAVTSNFGQFLVNGPLFGGMSGVVYGLFGYVWIRHRQDPSSGYYLDQPTVVMMIAWYFLCLFGLIGNVANTAHTVGLLGGIAWGGLAHWYKSARR